MKSFSQAISDLKHKLGSTGVSSNSAILSDEFVCDARQNDSIDLAIVGNLVRSWNILSEIEQFVFMNRDFSTILVGFGVADRVHHDIPMFLGCRFTESIPSIQVTPRVLLSTSKAVWPSIQVHVCVESPESRSGSIKILDSLCDTYIPCNFSHLIPACENFKDTGLCFDSYKREVFELGKRISSPSDKLEKVVLAREVSFELESELNPFALLNQVLLATEKSDGGKRYIAVIKEAKVCGKTFISVTPERLCRVNGNELKTEALAGTWKRDSQFKMTSKLTREHEIVVDQIKSSCLEIGDVVIDQTPHAIDLCEVSHRRQNIRVKSKKTFGGLKGHDLLMWSVERLHPTAAVAGYPKKEAMGCIEKMERFSRGFFAGVFGYSADFSALSTKNGELCVLIRSASVDDKFVKLYAGAGIVEESDPEEEWQEMETKMSQFKSVILSNLKIGDSFFYRNSTEWLSEIVIDNLVRQGVSLFVICPGSRSSPLTSAVGKNSTAAMTCVIIHDERSAGFYAVGAARAGALPAVIVTSGTAVANLMPCVCEAREAGLPLILLTADRPARSWDVGEAQTTRQLGMFSQLVGFQKSYSAPISSASQYLAATFFPSVVADVCFGAAEIARNRNQVVQFNFEFEKSDFDSDYQIVPRSNWNIPKGHYPKHISRNVHIPHIVNQSIASGSCLFVVGQLRDPNDAISIKYFVEKYNVPCLAEALSLIPPGSPNVVSCPERAFSSSSLTQKLKESIRCIVRMGGPLVSAGLGERLTDFSSATYIRVAPIHYPRHDPHYLVDIHIDASPVGFLQSLEIPPVQNTFPILEIFNKIGNIIDSHYTAALSEISEFNEPLIAHTLAKFKGSFFLSSSMPVRDFSSFGSVGLEKCSWSYRVVTSNRGVNGIDGVISSACGFSAFISGPTFLLIGDVAALHDLSGLAIALNVHPGSSHISLNKAQLKIVCVNNSGGAIFSFLKIKERSTRFDPFFNTPHQMSICDIAKHR